jgi:hypothetical protein
LQCLAGAAAALGTLGAFHPLRAFHALGTLHSLGPLHPLRPIGTYHPVAAAILLPIRLPVLATVRLAVGPAVFLANVTGGAFRRTVFLPHVTGGAFRRTVFLANVTGGALRRTVCTAVFLANIRRLGKNQAGAGATQDQRGDCSSDDAFVQQHGGAPFVDSPCRAST